MYVSSMMRSLYEKNLVWGRYYETFKDPKDNLNEFTTFLKIFMRSILKHEFFISEDFEATAEIKGSHSLTLVYRFVKEKKLASHCITYLVNEMSKNAELRKSPKVNIFLAELYCLQGKYSKSIECTTFLAR